MSRSTRLSAVPVSAGLLALLLTAPASAAPMYSFDQANYTVAPGGSVDVQVFLAGNDDPLISAGVRVYFDDPIPTEPAAVLSVADIFANPAFNDPFPGNPEIDVDPGVSAGLWELGDVLDPNFFGVPPVGSRVYLGTFRFTAGSVVGEVTEIFARDRDGTLDETATFFGTLDALIAEGRATITVVEPPAAIPEPASVVLFAVLGLGTLLAAAGRRR